MDVDEVLRLPGEGRWGRGRRLWRARELVAVLGVERWGIRVKDMARKNQVRAYLTDKGEAALQDAARRESIDRIMSQLPAADRHHMIQATEKLSLISVT